jgi:hypothetical protein
MLPLNLRPFGIEGTIHDTTELNELNDFEFAPGHHVSIPGTDTIRRFVIDGKRYNVKEKLGKGTYGVTYKVEDSSGREYAVKITKKLRGRDKTHFLIECITQIVMELGSRDETDGPYVPVVYGVGLDPDTGRGYLCSELMRNTLDSLIDVNGPADNNIVIPDALTQIAKMLDFFYKKFRFNHRDLKADNVMYVKKGARRVFKLIDFGFSCLSIPRRDTYPLTIKGSSYFDSMRECFKEERDMSQLMYQILDYKAKMSPELFSRLSDMLVANVKRHKCRMADGCPLHKMERWKNTYNFLNRTNVRVPFGEPSRVTEQMKLFAEGKPLDRAVLKLVAKPCPPGTVRHPTTRRCVKEGGKAWRSFNPVAAANAPCKEGEERNPATRRCIKKCPEGTRRVEGTRRCVKKLKPASTEVE